ncbi:hypothetical protein [Rhizobium sp. 28DA2]|uniref:hypothetical protein n=1 Tax=Rhizobium sp. 28DA2 TaxID=3035209 RepID=UPI002B255E84|nr:hypothetical protein [Rhizobium sp. 28DA2]
MLIGLVVASLLVIIGFQAPSGIKAISKTSRLERLQTADLSHSPSLRDKDCTTGDDHGCKARNGASGLRPVGFPSTILRIVADATPGRHTCCHRATNFPRLCERGSKSTSAYYLLVIPAVLIIRFLANLEGSESSETRRRLQFQRENRRRI